MTTTYSYAVLPAPGDFPNQAVNEDKLTAAIAASDPAISSAQLEAIRTAEDEETAAVTCMIDFDGDLSAGDQTQLDAIVAAHDGQPPTKICFHASSKLLEGEAAITNPSGFDVLGGVVTTPDFFTANLAACLGRMVGSCKATGEGAELRLVEDGATVLGTFAITDSSGAWGQMQWFTSTPPSAGTHTYTIEGKLNGATSAAARFTSLSLLEVVPA
jgi:hypothetical protein